MSAEPRFKAPGAQTRPPLEERAALDYYLEGGLCVFTERTHLKRGYCCGSGCRHCPFTPRAVQGVRQVDPAVAVLLNDPPASQGP